MHACKKKLYIPSSHERTGLVPFSEAEQTPGDGLYGLVSPQRRRCVPLLLRGEETAGVGEERHRGTALMIPPPRRGEGRRGIEERGGRECRCTVPSSGGDGTPGSHVAARDCILGVASLPPLQRRRQISRSRQWRCSGMDTRAGSLHPPFGQSSANNSGGEPPDWPPALPVISILYL